MPLKARGMLMSKGSGVGWKGELQRKWAPIPVIGVERYDALKAFADDHDISETVACRLILNAGIEQLERIKKLKAHALKLMEDSRVYNSSNAADARAGEVDHD